MGSLFVVTFFVCKSFVLFVVLCYISVYHMTSRSGSDITPCNKIDKLLEVYRFLRSVMTSINHNAAYKMANY